MIRYLLLISFIILLTSCSDHKNTTTKASSKDSVSSNQPKTEAVAETKKVTPTRKNAAADNLASVTSSPEEARIFQELLDSYNLAMCDGNTDSNVNDCYAINSKGMQMDFIEKRPNSLSFPYNSDYSISGINEIDKLEFLTKLCGFQREDGEVVNYYCLKSESKLMDYLKGSNNDIIIDYVTTYQKTKTTGPDFRSRLLLNGSNSLDFTNPRHRLFYMMFHLMSHEEHTAAKKI